MSVSGQPLLIGSFLCLFYSSFSRSLSSDFFQFPLLFTFFFFSIFFLRTASFHGDTNGLATIPIITAIEEIASSKYPGHVLIIGLDANTYNSRTADYQSVSIFLFFINLSTFYKCLDADTCNSRTADCQGVFFLLTRHGMRVALRVLPRRGCTSSLT